MFGDGSLGMVQSQRTHQNSPKVPRMPGSFSVQETMPFCQDCIRDSAWARDSPSWLAPVRGSWGAYQRILEGSQKCSFIWIMISLNLTEWPNGVWALFPNTRRPRFSTWLTRHCVNWSAGMPSWWRGCLGLCRLLLCCFVFTSLAGRHIASFNVSISQKSSSNTTLTSKANALQPNTFNATQSC